MGVMPSCERKVEKWQKGQGKRDEARGSGLPWILRWTLVSILTPFTLLHFFNAFSPTPLPFPYRNLWTHIFISSSEFLILKLGWWKGENRRSTCDADNEGRPTFRIQKRTQFISYGNNVINGAENCKSYLRIKCHLSWTLNS